MREPTMLRPRTKCSKALPGQSADNLCTAVHDFRATDWTGKIINLSSNGDGWGVLDIEIDSGITLSTTNNSISNAVEMTLIDPSSAIFNTASKLSEGQNVKFSGSFLASETDCVEERSLTLRGSIDKPDFAFRFASIEAIQ